MADSPHRLAGVLLVDRRGWILLQERDEHAPIAPDQWGLVGGHVEVGESFEAAAYRELEEEFVDPASTSTLDLGDTAATVLLEFLASQTYRALKNSHIASDAHNGSDSVGLPNH